LIEKNPEKYRMSYYNITKDEINYTESLQDILKRYINSDDNRIYNRVLSGIKSYLLNQPRYVGNMYLSKLKGLNKIYKNIFVISNAKEFILNELPKIYKTKKYNEVLSGLELEMIALEENKNQFLKELESLTFKTLSKEAYYDLTSYMENLEVNEKNLEIDEYLKPLKNASTEEILENITKKIKGFSYQNWRGEEDLKEYAQLLNKEVLKTKVEKNENSEKNSLKIKYQDREETISISELNMMEKMLSSKISATIKNMGFSLTTEQKRKVVAKILLEIQE
ncbi:MAG: hypothetical protein ACRCZ9_12960, partial [Fusobacteriaceae bacterium]